MKIGILTYHNNENKGAILQSWCLVKTLQNHFSDATVEIIDYRTRSKELRRARSAMVTRKLTQIPIRFQDWRQCQQFIRDNLPTSETKIITDDYSKAAEKLQKLNYDLLVVGSDEVWKVTEPDAGRPIIDPKRPFPNLYYPDSSVTVPKVSYAASANQVDPEKLTLDQFREMKYRLNNFNLISVRDNHTEGLLKKFGITNIHKVPDPTLMFNIPSRDVKSILGRNGVDPNKKILGFHGTDNPVFKNICNRYKKEGYQIISMTWSRFADFNLRGRVDPFEYYSIYNYFDMVVTNSLHSSIFSIKQGIPFATIDTSSVYNNIESKTYSLLHDFDMLDRHINAVDGDASEFFENRDALESKPDDTHIKNQTHKLQKCGNDFLDRIEELL